MKIPHLYISNNKTKLKKKNISKILSRKLTLSFYIEQIINGEKLEIFCEIMENGEVNIKFNSTTLLTIDNVNKIIKDNLDNIFLKKIRDKIKQSGYNYINLKKFKIMNILRLTIYTFLF